MRIPVICIAACIAAVAAAQSQQQPQPQPQPQTQTQTQTQTQPLDQGPTGGIKQGLTPGQKKPRRRGWRWPARWEIEERMNLFKAFRADESAKDDTVLTASSLKMLSLKPAVYKQQIHAKSKQEMVHKKVKKAPKS